MSRAAGEDPVRRSYSSELRSAQAGETRRRIVAAAADLFGARGYRGTHLRDIAAAAGVSVQSVHLAGTKASLLLAALEYLSVGADSGPVVDAPEVAAALAELRGPEDFVGWFARFAAVSNERVGGIWFALEHAAREDPEVAAAADAMIARMRADARQGVELALQRGSGTATRPAERDVQELADAVWALSLPDLHHRLVHQAGWSAGQYSAMLERLMLSVLRGARTV